jgi:anti-sigma-K factor RskA
MNARERLSDYLLGELSPAETSRFEAALAADADLRAEVERLRPVVARLEAIEPAAWDPPEPPPPVVPDVAREPSAPRWWQRRLTLRLAPAAALAAVLLALGVGAGLLARGGGGDDGGRAVALAPVAPLGAGAQGTARFETSRGRAVVHLAGLRPSRAGDFYELWLLNSPSDLVSLGSFRVPASGEVDVTVPVPADPARFSALDLSLEPPDGNPAHSKRSVLRAPLKPA